MSEAWDYFSAYVCRLQTRPPRDLQERSERLEALITWVPAQSEDDEEGRHAIAAQREGIADYYTDHDKQPE